MPTSDRAPQLPLDWEEGVFRGLLGLYRRLTHRPEVLPPGAITLAEHEASLRVLASLIAGEPLRVLPATGAGGLRGRDVLLPATVALSADPEENRQLWVVRAALAGMMRRQGAIAPADPAARAQATRRAGERAAAALGELFPEFPVRLAQVTALVRAARPDDQALGWLYGELIPALSDAPDLLRAGGDDQRPPTGTERTMAKPPEEVHRVILDEEKAREQVLVHTFEKVETLDTHKGQLRKLDGSDDLDDHAEALDEVDLRDLIRGGEAAQSLLRAEVGLDADIPDVAAEIPGERGVPYDEWDGRNSRYRKDWATVYPTPFEAGDGRWAAEVRQRQRRLILQLRRRLEQHRARLQPLPRQREGEEVDIDALTDALGDRLAGRGEPERVYRRRSRLRRDQATTVLLDMSLSTDAWVQGRRVLDVAREAVLVLGEVADALGDPLQVLAFASHTRNRCRVYEVRGWNEPWAVGAARLGALRPQGYTRIGPALRHATAELCRAPAERRLLLLISDGKPTDYDRYEGRYGTADVRQAIREADARGVVTHALAIDAVARDALPAMMGPGAWHILPHPDRLPEALATVYGRLTGR